MQSKIVGTEFLTSWVGGPDCKSDTAIGSIKSDSAILWTKFFTFSDFYTAFTVCSG